MKREPITPGTRFGRWTVLEGVARPPGVYVYQYKAVCDCGTVGFPRTQFLRSGRSQSCGCIQREMMRARQTRHGFHGLPEYDAFVNARYRCTSPNAINYDDYGGRGIEFRFETFEEFFADVGPRPTPKHTLDRIDNNRHYEPGNLRWATRHEQRINQRPRRTKGAYAESV